MPSQDEIARIEELIFLHRRRLHLLQCRAAIEGIAVDPMVIIQIEDTLATIGRLEQKLALLDTPDEPAPPADDARTEVELVLAEAGRRASGRASAVAGRLASLLNIAREQITDLRSSDPDGAVRMELPTVAANRLFSLFRADDYKFRGLDIQEIRVIYRQPFPSALSPPESIGEPFQERGADQGARNEGEDGMNVKVLLVDNDTSYLDATARFLEVNGYEVYRAVSLERARQLLDYTWVHIALIDVRLRDDTDIKDASGLQLAKDPAYRSVPKIMMTQFPTYEYVREALGPNLEGLPAAVDFLSKLNGTQPILRALEQTFEQRVRINRELTITWNQPSSFPHLVNQIQPEQDNERLLDRAGELADLFRKLFYDSGQVTIGRALKHGPGWLLLEVFAYGKAGNERQFVVSCGKNARIAEASRRYDEVAPQGAGVGGTVKQASAETLRFAATAYMLISGDLEEMVTFRTYFQSRSADDVTASLRRLYTETLPAWYSKGREQQHGANLVERYERGLDLDAGLLAPDLLREHIAALCQRMLATGLVGGVELTERELTLRFANGAVFAGALPVAQRYDEHIKPDAPALYGVIHGSVDPDSILVNSAGQTWLIDFTRVGRGLLLQDFIVMETAMKLELIETLDMAERHVIEQRLLEPTTLSDAPRLDDLPPEIQRIALAIAQIRASAADLTGDQLASYQIGMFFCALKYVASYEPALHYTRRRLIPYAHGLLLATMLYAILNRPVDQPAQPLPALRLDMSNEVAWLGDRQIDLTPREYQLLRFLYEGAGQLRTRQAIADHMLDTDYDTTDESWLNSLVNRLRLKIEPDPDRPRYLLTVRGRGYRLVVAPE